MKNKPKIIVALPAYNEAQVIAETIRDVIRAGYKEIIVVNDGSKDNTALIAEKIGASVVSHPVNRGLGAARSTGNEAALRAGADIIVQMDADGQHDPRDIDRVIQPIIDGKAEVVIGSRFLGKNDIPISRRILNWMGNLVTRIFFGKWVSDSQTGFKAFSRYAAENLDTRFDTYEWESEVIREIARHKWSYAEVPISVRYTEHSLSKGQNLANGVRMGWRMMWRAILG